jgi:hypothetical protein
MLVGPDYNSNSSNKLVSMKPTSKMAVDQDLMFKPKKPLINFEQILQSQINTILMTDRVIQEHRELKA